MFSSFTRFKLLESITKPKSCNRLIPKVIEPWPLIAGTILQSLDSSLISLGSAESATIKLSPANLWLRCAICEVVKCVWWMHSLTYIILFALSMLVWTNVVGSLLNPKSCPYTDVATSLNSPSFQLENIFDENYM